MLEKKGAEKNWRFGESLLLCGFEICTWHLILDEVFILIIVQKHHLTS
jgi:hypothetical protein